LGSGAHGISDIKCHPFFASIDWDKLLKKQVPGSSWTITISPFFTFVRNDSEPCEERDEKVDKERLKRLGWRKGRYIIF
jgi:hypothetical protein